MADKRSNRLRKIKVWDIGTRLFHWSLVVLFALSAFSAFQDKFDIYADMHLFSGFGILVLVVWRIVWGFWGSETSRFRQFVKSPKTVIAALKAGDNPPVGHSAVGGYSVLLMLLLLLAQTCLGMFASDDMLFSGPLSDHAGAAAADIRDIHALLGRILMGVVFLHIAAILWYLLVRKINLIWPMVAGCKAVEEDVESQKFVSFWFAAIIFLALLALLMWLIF